jgi:hypothetical protein
VAADFLDLKMLGSYKSTYGVSYTGGTKWSILFSDFSL